LLGIRIFLRKNTQANTKKQERKYCAFHLTKIGENPVKTLNLKLIIRIYNG
jgi:hypothetical protein